MAQEYDKFPEGSRTRPASGQGSDPHYDYKNDVLKNKHNIPDPDVLDIVLNRRSRKRIQELESKPLEGNYDQAHFQNFHKYIFKDTFDWAGEIRHINIEKSQDVLANESVDTVQYSDTQKISEQLTKHLTEINSIDYKRPASEVIEDLAKPMAALWKTHAFREGNTRTTLAYVTQITREKGLDLDPVVLAANTAVSKEDKIDNIVKYNKETINIRDALVLAAAKSNYEPLKKIINAAHDVAKGALKDATKHLARYKVTLQSEKYLAARGYSDTAKSLVKEQLKQHKIDGQQYKNIKAEISKISNKSKSKSSDLEIG